MATAGPALAMGPEQNALRTNTHERLLDLRGSVIDGGDTASFSVAYTNHKPFRVLVDIEEIGPIFNELRHISNQMMRRQKLKLDRGARKMMDLVEHARKPSHVEVLMDPTSGDTILIFLFRDAAPMAIRMTPFDMVSFDQSRAVAKARTAN